jgi:CRISPR/Cas system-associated protein endoribonuclease Cas2
LCIYKDMILPKESKPEKKPEIDLTGPDGNAFVLIARAKQYARELGLDGEMITKEMMLGDYEDLLQTFERYFGDYVILYR